MPLRKIKVLELAGLAPAPFCGMILADFGASVVRVDKTGVSHPDVLAAGKKSISLNLKDKKAVEIFKKMCDQSDVIIDPFRKGVMEKLKLGPSDLMKTNKKLIYARLTGFGQEGPYARMAGHDINFLALSGLLSFFGRSGDKPLPPVNFAADFAGGGLICALGILLALYERTESKLGQIIDASMVEGAAYVGSWLFRSQNIPGLWGRPRGKNILDSGTHFYDTYETSDGKFLAVGALEPHFYAILLQKLGMNDEELPQFENFLENKKKLTEIFRSKTQEEWTKIFDGSDACVTPVLTPKNVYKHPHNKERQSFSLENKIVVPKPAPRLSRTPGQSSAKLQSPLAGENSREVLLNYGFDEREINEFIQSGIVQQLHRSKL
ncbi:alpha-methylacyl-CoA racemase isoform X1 [Cotesia glomerata]|uniref:alpha-methylacyl-CoA racemase isoform X1 n=2 Tax=Cotesia glomerata TaxID=32391 RepID=UPI001D01B1C7|nr:alpha-methylacyl-CoA racemase isoform X1 [Cotesia glomerata]